MSDPPRRLDQRLGDVEIAESSSDFSALKRVLGDPDPRVRKRAVRALGRVGGAGALEALGQTMGASNASVRAAAAVELGAQEPEGALDPLTNALDDKSEYVRSEAARSLGRLRHRDAVAPLVEFAKREPHDSWARYSAADALLLLGHAKKRGRAVAVIDSAGVPTRLTRRLGTEPGVYAEDPTTGRPVWVAALQRPRSKGGQASPFWAARTSFPTWGPSTRREVELTRRRWG